MATSKYNACINAIRELVPNAEEVVADIEAKLKARIQVAQEGTDAALAAIQKEKADWAKYQEVLKKRNALISHIKATDNRDFIRSFKSRAEGLLAITDGSARIGIKGSKAGVYDESRGWADIFVEDVRSGLMEEDLLDVVVSGKMDDDLAEELQILNWNKKHPDKPRQAVNDAAHRAAVVMDGVTERMNDMLRKEGADITIRDDYVMKRYWDTDKVRALGKQRLVGTPKGIDTAYARWREIMDPIIDPKKTFEEAGIAVEDREGWLKAVFVDIYTGDHSKVGSASSTGRKTFRRGSLADKITAQRKIHLKNAKDEVTIAKNFGADTLMNSMEKNARRNALDLALLRRFGPNDPMAQWLALRDGEIADLKRKAPPDIDKQVDDLNNARIENTMHSLLGDFDRVTDNVHWHRIVQAFKTLATLSKMGTSTITAVPGDAVTFKFAGRRLGIPAREINAALARIPFQTKEGKAVAHAMGFALDSHNGDSLARLRAASAEPGSFQGKVLHKYFSLIGMNQWNEGAKGSFVRMVSGYFGEHADDAFDALPELLRKGLLEYGIDADEWGVIRLATTDYKEWGSIKVMDPTAIKGLPDAEIDKLLDIRGLSKTEFSRGRVRTELEAKYRTLLHKEANRAILTPGNRESRMSMFSSQKGTAARLMADVFMQFKVFGLTYYNEIIKTMIYESGAESLSHFMRSGKFLHLKHFGLMAELVMAGYISNSIKDGLKGFAPRRMWTEDGTFLQDVHMKTFLDAFVRAGGLGFMVETLGQELSRGISRGTGQVLGPALELPADMVGIAWNAFRDIADPDADVDQLEFALRSFRRHGPALNVFYLDPIFRYMIFNAFTESLAPGSLRKSARRVEKRNFQTKFLEDRQFPEKPASVEFVEELLQ